METTESTSAKSQRIQELYRQSIDQNAQEARTYKWINIIVCIVLPVLLCWTFASSIKSWVGIAAIVVITALCVASCLNEVKGCILMSHAQNVDGLLDINTRIKRLKKYSYCLGVVIFYAAYVALRYDTSDDFNLVKTLILAVNWGVVWIIIYHYDNRDSSEIKEIKQLLTTE